MSSVMRRRKGLMDRSVIGAALLSQLMANLTALHVAALRTTVAWNNFSLLGFLSRSGFRPAQQLVLSLQIT
jgi:hypothetical protein